MHLQRVDGPFPLLHLLAQLLYRLARHLQLHFQLTPLLGLHTAKKILPGERTALTDIKKMVARQTGLVLSISLKLYKSVRR